jgi:hypothetical protein
MLNNGDEILARDGKRGHHFSTTSSLVDMKLEKAVNESKKDTISKAEAFVWGMFFCSGHCSFIELSEEDKKIRPSLAYKDVTYHWRITSTISALLNKCKIFLEEIYPYKWEISVRNEDTGLYTLSLKYSDGVEHFLKKTMTMFYQGEAKRVPKVILNGSLLVKQEFFDGCFSGEENELFLNKHKKFIHFNIEGQVGSQGMCYLMDLLGYPYYVYEDNKYYSIYTVHEGNKAKGCEGVVSDVRDINYTNSFVYDIETENHLLNAGVGKLVVHNCDGIHISGLIQNLFHSLFPSLLERDESFIVSLQTPIVRVFMKGEKDKLFYDERSYKEWAENYKKEHPNKKINQKYYKGLGTSDEDAVRETFGKKIIEFVPDEHTSANMNKVFHKKNSDQRKEWLAGRKLFR